MVSKYDYTGERIEKDIQAQFPDARLIAPHSVGAGNLPDLCDVLSPKDLQAFTGYEMEESVGGIVTESGLHNMLTGKDDLRQATSSCSWSGVENHFKIKADISVGPVWSAKAWRKLNPGVESKSRGQLGKSYYSFSDGWDLVTLVFWRGTMTYKIEGYLDDQPSPEGRAVRLGEKLLNGLPEGPR